MSETPDVHLERIVEAIALYLEQHPGAADSEEGIAKFWLPTLNVEASSEEVHIALSVLMRAGLVERVRSALFRRAGGSESEGSTSQ